MNRRERKAFELLHAAGAGSLSPNEIDHGFSQLRQEFGDEEPSAKGPKVTRPRRRTFVDLASPKEDL
jgi:hypothetical protein